MTKKHFEAFAREISSIEDERARTAAATAVAHVCARFSQTFNMARFFAACRVL